MAQQVSPLGISRHFTQENVSPYDMLPWTTRHAVAEARILNDIEFPENWSLTAASKLASFLPTNTRETSLRFLFDRVAHAIATYGFDEGYFATERESVIFADELKFILATQRATFDTPVWQTVGVIGQTQRIADKVVLVNEASDAPMDLHQRLGHLAKDSRFVGVNAQELARTRAELRGHFTAAAALADVAAAHQPSLTATISIDQFFDMSLDDQKVHCIVNVPDDFLRAAEAKREWTPKGQGKIAASAVLQSLASALRLGKARQVQFGTAASDWQLTNELPPTTIDGSFFAVGDAAISPVSINALAFLQLSDGSLDTAAFCHTVTIMTTAAEILLSYAHYPDEQIDDYMRMARPLAIEAVNIGGLLMAKGLAYDSVEAREYAQAVLGIMSAQAYQTSAQLALRVGESQLSATHRSALVRIVHKHRAALAASAQPEQITAQRLWDEAVEAVEAAGVRNAQVTTLGGQHSAHALLDTESAGVLPLPYLVQTNGSITIHSAVPLALKSLGYTRTEAEAIIAHLGTTHTLHGAPFFRQEHFGVFASLSDQGYGVTTESILKMIATAQPMVSGGTGMRLPVASEIDDDEVALLVLRAWKLGLKSLSLSVGELHDVPAKAPAPLNDESEAEVLTAFGFGKYMAESPVTQQQPKEKKIVKSADTATATPNATEGLRTLPAKRRARTYEFSVADCKLFMTTGEFSDGQLGELFLRVAKQDATLGGMMDALAISVSHGLQRGVPLKDYVQAFVGQSFGPAGATTDPEVPTATSLIDYAFRRLARDYLSFEDQLAIGLVAPEDEATISQQRLLD